VASTAAANRRTCPPIFHVGAVVVHLQRSQFAHAQHRRTAPDGHSERSRGESPALYMSPFPGLLFAAGCVPAILKTHDDFGSGVLQGGP
jgi:hypothetical protein